MADFSTWPEAGPVTEVCCGPCTIPHHHLTFDWLKHIPDLARTSRHRHPSPHCELDFDIVFQSTNLRSTVALWSQSRHAQWPPHSALPSSAAPSPVCREHPPPPPCPHSDSPATHRDHPSSCSSELHSRPPPSAPFSPPFLRQSRAPSTTLRRCLTQSPATAATIGLSRGNITSESWQRMRHRTLTPYALYRLVSAALVPITVAPFAAGSLSPLIDGTLIGLLIIHTYIGFQ